MLTNPGYFILRCVSPGTPLRRRQSNCSNIDRFLCWRGARHDGDDTRDFAHLFLLMSQTFFSNFSLPERRGEPSLYIYVIYIYLLNTPISVQRVFKFVLSTIATASPQSGPRNLLSGQIPLDTGYLCVSHDKAVACFDEEPTDDAKPARGARTQQVK